MSSSEDILYISTVIDFMDWAVQLVNNDRLPDELSGARIMLDCYWIAGRKLAMQSLQGYTSYP